MHFDWMCRPRAGAATVRSCMHTPLRCMNTSSGSCVVVAVVVNNLITGRSVSVSETNEGNMRLWRKRRGGEGE